MEQCGDSAFTRLACDMTSTSCSPLSSPAVHQEFHPTIGGSPDLPVASISTKSAQRAYLQSLDRSSRAWVLSSGKTQASHETTGLQEESSSNIWYNPIPEEDDPGDPHREGEDWRRETEVGGYGATQRTGRGDIWVGSAETFSNDCLLEGAQPCVSHRSDDITTENTSKRT